MTRKERTLPSGLRARVETARTTLLSAYPDVRNFAEREVGALLTFGRVHDELVAAGTLIAEVSRRLVGMREPIMVDPEDDDRVAHGVAASRTTLASGYDELLATGFGRVVLFETSDGTLRLWRIGQANVSEMSARVVNRLAPVARLLIPARVGDEVELPNVGIVSIVEISGLSGFSPAGPEFEIAVIQDDQFGKRQLSFLSRALEKWVRVPLDAPRTALSPDDRQSGEVPASLPAPAAPGRREGMDAGFYVNTTRAQELILAARESGYLVVNGVAGSGKTAIALGRVKALCDVRYEKVDPTAHYFQPELCMGFVLRPSLIEYLRSTCHQLQLATMPIQDLEALRISLAQHFAVLLKLGSAKGRTGYEWEDSQDGDTGYLSSVEFLKGVDEAVLAEWTRRAAGALQQPMQVPAGLPADTRLAMDVLRRRALAVVELLRRAGASTSGFSCHGLIGKFIDIGKDIVRLTNTPPPNDAPLWWQLKNGDLVPESEGSTQLGARAVDPFRTDRYRTSDQKAAIEQAKRQFRARLLQDLGLATESVPDLATIYRKKLQSIGGGLGERVASVADMIGKGALSTPVLDGLLALACLLTAGCQQVKTPHLRGPALARHVFIDEYQDYSEVELLLLGLQADPTKHRSITLSGDPLQQLSGNAAPDFGVLQDIGAVLAAPAIFLAENMRQSPDLAKLSLAYRKDVLHDADIPDTGDVAPFTEQVSSYRRTGSADAAAIVDAVLEARVNQSVAVLCSHLEDAEALYKLCRQPLGRRFRSAAFSSDSRDLVKRLPVHFSTADAAKGLEFDFVVVVEPGRFLSRPEAGANALYVGISRARERLVILESSPGVWN